MEQGRFQRLRKRAMRRAARIPPGWRSGAGVLLIVGGVLGFLPILGFWMIPLGIAVIGFDIAAWRRRRRRAATSPPRPPSP